MPELPEVETIRRQLSLHVIGHEFTGVKLIWPKAILTPSPEKFCRRIISQKIISINRRGKYMLLRLSGGNTLIIHLKMTGILMLDPTDEKLRKYITTVFSLDDGATDLYFIDQRKFGSIWLVEDESTVIGKLGPEPLEKTFTPAVLDQILKKHRIPVKALLCDQHAIAGIGNMYADEALFASHIHPTRPANALSRDEIRKLHSAIQAVLQKGIQNGGASIQNYLHPNGDRGSAHSEFKVAHRFRQSCFTCGAVLERIRIRGRGTYFCPNCQPQ